MPPPPRRSNRRTPRDEAERQRQLAQRARTHLQRGSVQRSARTLSATPLVEVDDAVLHQLRDKHPQTESPHLPRTTAPTLPPVSVSADTFREVLQKLPKSSAAGPSGWTYDQLKSAMLHDEGAFEGSLWCVNAQLAGTLRNCPNLLASRLIPCSKQSAEQLLMQPAGAVPTV